MSPVSIHAPVWVRLPFIVIAPATNKFQFTHPCGCDSSGGLLQLPTSCFNSRTRVGATLQDRGVFRIGDVSIHAPVWVRLN